PTSAYRVTDRCREAALFKAFSVTLTAAAPRNAGCAAYPPNEFTVRHPVVPERASNNGHGCAGFERVALDDNWCRVGTN
ncbi:MAG: hypothetical protein OXU20_13280, partial [Myxococcales bacterium]|nr:hypothetical protein [Myxococcales bacterium]